MPRSRSHFDLTDGASHDHLYRLTEDLLATGADTGDIQAAAAGAPLEFKLAAKLVDSRRYLLSQTEPLRVAVVFAMWGEHHRLHPRTDDNPNGEDSLRVKLEQLRWATADTPLDWSLWAVDDGCPHDSGAIAGSIADEHPLADRVRVRFLAEAVPADGGPLAGLESADHSRKGGAIIHGATEAIAEGADVVIYTDADNSVHLGQIGLLLRPYLDGGNRAVIGNRKHPDAVLVKQEGRWGVGIKLLRHMQRMIGQPIFSLGIHDTQAAFKLYDADLLGRIVAEPTVYDFSFDTDWLLGVIAEGAPFTTVPFAFIDSAAESASITQGPMTTWETLLHGLTAAVRARGLPHNEEMALVLDEEVPTAAELDQLIDRLPPELEHVTDAQLGDPAVMSPQAVRAWVRQCTGAAAQQCTGAAVSRSDQSPSPSTAQPDPA